MQRRFLIRARGLASFRQALVDRAIAGGPLEARRRMILVPTRAAGALLRLTIEQHVARSGASAVVCPDLLTRDEWLLRMLAAVEGHPRWLSRIERLVLLERAARETLERRAHIEPPFHLRPGLVAAMLDFYDELRRRQRRVRKFARTIFDDLRVERGTDRGSEGLINQTRFLGFAFLAYERAARESGGVDEHELRRLLLDAQPALPFDDLIVAVADHPADPRGLWPSDFDLIGRLRTLDHVQIVMTDEAHDAGFRARVEAELPGIEETRAPDVVRAPALVLLPSDPAGPRDVPLSLCRDREEELRTVARHIRARAEANGGALPGATAVVFHRPLPYLYLAQQVMTDARVPYRAADALPLAAEPYAALLDLAMAVARTNGTREAVLALLRSPLVHLTVDGTVVSGLDVLALDDLLNQRRATGDAGTFVGEVEASASHGARARQQVARAMRAAVAASTAASLLAPCRSGVSGSAQLGALSGFLRRVERPDVERGAEHDRFRRARAAVLVVLDHLAEAFERYDDRARDLDDLAATIYHAIEDQTFLPTRGQSGIHLVDAVAARFGEFDDVFLVGLVETDWAERQRRSFFYSAGLLKALGWPQDTDQTLAQQAAFRDVLTLARGRTRLSAFQLDGDAVVALSTMIDTARGLPIVKEPALVTRPLFADEVLTGSTMPAGLEPPVAEWLALRHQRPDLAQRDYSGFVLPVSADIYRVSKVDRFVTCPFKYFAEQVLRLPEERDDVPGLTPIERGTMLHLLLERFYRTWQGDGHGAITGENMPVAQALFGRLADDLLATLPEPDRSLERLRIVGSLVAPGVADRVFELEAASSGSVVERLLESPLEGAFTFPVLNGLSSRTIQIKAKTDRIDVLADGSLRVVDYKLGRMPDLATSLQVAVYAHCARQWLETRDHREHPVSSAAYLAFGDDQRFEGRLAKTPDGVAMAVATRASDFSDAVARIEGGEFPPRPRKTSECQWCGYSGVCRKEYRIEDDESAESL
jgi:RecB family exonuclease